MGQKVHPIGFRVGVTKSWFSEWFASKKNQNEKFFIEDIKVRNFTENYYPRAGIGKLVIRKTDNENELIIFSAKIGIILGQQGKKLKVFQDKLEKEFNKSFKILVKEIRLPELSAKIIGEFACEQLEKRVPYRRVAKTVLQKVMEKGALGVKIQISGRLAGVDLARKEKFIDGRLPLQTLRSDIDYHYTTALTKYGILGVKVWIYKGDIYGPNTSVSNTTTKQKKSTSNKFNSNSSAKPKNSN